MMLKKKKKFKKEKKKIVMRKRSCRFCVDQNMPIDYKLPRQLLHFLSETGKINPRRSSGNCAYHQRRVVEAIKRARLLAMIPYTPAHANS